MLALSLCLSLGLSDGSGHAPSPEGDLATRSRIAELEAEGRFVRAAWLAEELLDSYPQDYGLALWAGWLRFGAGHYTRARRHYATAIDLSAGSIDSRLGLGWSLLYDGRRGEAIETLRALVEDAPHAKEPREALAFAERRWPVGVSPWVSATGHAYRGDPVLRHGFGVQAGLGLRIAEHLAVAASYGFTRLAYDAAAAEAIAQRAMQASGAVSGGGMGAGPGGAQGGGAGAGMPGSGHQVRGASDPLTGPAVRQHQLHASLGPVWRVAGATLHYGLLRDDGLDDVHALGSSLRWSPWGDLVLEASVTFGDRTRSRIAPSWRLPLHEHLWLRPLLAVQIEGDDSLVAGAMTLAVHGRPGSLWIGGKYGRERRPAYLDVPVIFNLAGEIRGGGWAGGRLELPRGVALFGGYEIAAVDAPTSTGVVPSLAHYAGLGASWTHI